MLKNLFKKQLFIRRTPTLQINNQRELRVFLLWRISSQLTVMMIALGLATSPAFAQPSVGTNQAQFTCDQAIKGGTVTNFAGSAISTGKCKFLCSCNSSFPKLKIKCPTGYVLSPEPVVCKLKKTDITTDRKSTSCNVTNSIERSKMNESCSKACVTSTTDITYRECVKKPGTVPERVTKPSSMQLNIK
jgi:hypothetical protein